MTDMREELIRRLEGATSPDPELGREILLACGWRRTCVGHFYGPLYNWSGPNGEHYHDDRLPCPTSSVDMALTIVPKHHLWEMRQGFEARAIVWMIETDYDERNPPTGYSTTFPAIALCIAALKARAEHDRHTEGASAHEVLTATKGE